MYGATVDCTVCRTVHVSLNAYTARSWHQWPPCNLLTKLVVLGWRIFLSTVTMTIELHTWHDSRRIDAEIGRNCRLGHVCILYQQCSLDHCQEVYISDALSIVEEVYAHISPNNSLVKKQGTGVSCVCMWINWYSPARGSIKMLVSIQTVRWLQTLAVCVCVSELSGMILSGLARISWCCHGYLRTLSTMVVHTHTASMLLMFSGKVTVYIHTSGH